MTGPDPGSGPVVVVAGGGTAGHVEPALNTADAVLRLRPDARVVALGTERGLEGRLVPARGHELRLVPPVPLPRSLTPQLLRVPGRLRAAVRAAREVLDEVRADVVVGFGGYVSVPAYLAARRRGTPFVVHEANARPGLANRLGAFLTPHVLVTVPDTKLRGADVVGLPLRAAVATLHREDARPAARSGFGLDPDRPVLLVFGGSQGAASLNRAVQAAWPSLRDLGVSVLHATGHAHHAGVVEALPEPRPDDPPYVALPYVDDMAAAYAAADVAVCRAGAMTVAELTAVGLPAVYVPLPIGNGEQALNAAPVVAAGGGVMVPDAELSGERLVAEVSELLSDPGRLAEAGRAAARLGRRGADEEVARRALAAAGVHVDGGTA